MTRRDPLDSPDQKRPTAPGAFRADGSWDFDAHPPDDHRHTLHWFVDMLVTRRKRTPEARPSLFVARIKASPFHHAFPNLTQWLELEAKIGPAGTIFWPFLPTSTSAEECVKRCGNGSAGHWCGEYYGRGPERDCRADGHRAEHNLERVRAMVAGMSLGVLAGAGAMLWITR